MIDAISREAGLYPYMSGSGRWHDLAALELMKAPGLDGIVFHIEQALTFQRLAQGKSVILSAPTSFGKSLLIDALLGFRSPATVVAVVPTIALLDEFRRRIGVKFPQYQVITTSSEARSGERTIFLGTQERLLEREDIGDVDLFIIDEFYKLDFDRGDRRSLALNAILARHGLRAKQLYLLGPSIDDVPNAASFRDDIEFVKTKYSPVTADIIDRTSEGPSPDGLIRDLRSTRGENSLVYMRSPRAAWLMAFRLMRGLDTQGSSFCRGLGDWIKENFHPEWVLGNSVHRGIGLHHGRIPRALAHLMIDLFNKGELETILCTSSMIEGVNTAAQNVFIYDKHISKSKLDRFTFDNIKGRAGRLFRHKIGRIFLYNAPPEETQFDVRIPLFDNGGITDPDLLVQVDDFVLSPTAQRQKRAITASSILPLEILSAWGSFGVDALNLLAEDLIDVLQNRPELYFWKGFPTFDQLEATFQIVWGRLDFEKHGLLSARQLAFFARTLRGSPTIRAYLNALVSKKAEEAQPEIDLALNFMRGAEYTFPQVLRALNDVIDVVTDSEHADYRVYAQHLQNLFLPSGHRALDEFGIPIPLTAKLGIPATEDIKGLLREVSSLDFPGRANLSAFENELLRIGVSPV
ncbi:MAG: hypothetical protein M3177_03295 [Pseudomonadota bacterium]|nr:hypothetical protein [Pseudomonadota bacterium]